MRKPFFAAALFLALILSSSLAAVHGCSRVGPFKFSELFDNATIIVRATATGYAVMPGDSKLRTTGTPDGQVSFRIDEVLRGEAVPKTIPLNGYLSHVDDFNETAVPYTFVRPNGRSGSCFANTYKVGGSFLLFIKKTESGYTTNISALGPSNEQLRSDNDPWLVWVKAELAKGAKSGKGKQSSELQTPLMRDSPWPALLVGCLVAMAVRDLV